VAAPAEMSSILERAADARVRLGLARPEGAELSNPWDGARLAPGGDRPGGFVNPPPG